VAVVEDVRRLTRLRRLAWEDTRGNEFSVRSTQRQGDQEIFDSLNRQGLLSYTRWESSTGSSQSGR
jgi:hypothetical protein